MTIKQLRYVEAAERTGSIAAAANELNISQSSITAAIDSMEARLGFDLFTRVPAKGIRTTPAGREAIGPIRHFLDGFHDFEADLQAIGGASTGTVRVACFATAAASFLPVLIRQFAQDHAGIAIALVEGNMETIIDELDAGRADIAFTYADVVLDHQVFEDLVAVPPYALLPADDTICEGTHVTLEDLAKRRLILLDLPRTRGYYSDIFRDAGLSVEIFHVTASTEMIRTLVESGLGFSVLSARPPNYVEGARRYKAMPIARAAPERRFGFV
ncbi:MAG: LysR family transcriptional regulator, partial [Pseudomonadota bacterium]